jgi:hypothetical protein
MLTLKEAKDFVNTQLPSYDTVKLGDLEFFCEGGSLPGSTTGLTSPFVVDRNTGTQYLLGNEGGLDAFCKYLGVPSKFLVKLPGKMQNEAVNYFLGNNSEGLGVLSHMDSSVHGVYKPSAVILPPSQVMEMIGRIFKDEDVVARLSYTEGLEVNIHTPQLFVDARPDDRTNGGIRFLALNGKTPQVSAYMERLVCTNGMVATGDFDLIGVKGYSMAEILNNMEATANLLLEKSIPDYLDNWKKMTTIRSSNPEQLIHRLSREAELSTKLESRIIESASSLTSDTYYDIVNLVTSFQHIDGVDGEQFNKVQKLGGGAVRDLGGHRCNNCQHNLEA